MYSVKPTRLSKSAAQGQPSKSVLWYVRDELNMRLVKTETYSDTGILQDGAEG